MECGDEIDDALAADPVIAGMDGADGGLQVAGESVFEHDAARADLQGLNDLLRGDGGGEKKNLGRGGAAHDGAHGLKAGQARHGNIEKKNIRLKFEGLRDGFVAVGGISDYVKAIVFGKHIAHANAHDRVVVRQHDSNGSFHFSHTPPLFQIRAPGDAADQAGNSASSIRSNPWAAARKSLSRTALLSNWLSLKLSGVDSKSAPRRAA